MQSVCSHTMQTILTALVGNKVDKSDMRIVSEEQGKCLAEKLGWDFWETSAKCAQNLDSMFKSIVTHSVKIKNRQAQIQSTAQNQSTHQIELKTRAGDGGDQCFK
jgi:hypothetical protein